jgi:hypothetical protein
LPVQHHWELNHLPDESPDVALDLSAERVRAGFVASRALIPSAILLGCENHPPGEPLGVAIHLSCEGIFAGLVAPRKLFPSDHLLLYCELNHPPDEAPHAVRNLS